MVKLAALLLVALSVRTTSADTSMKGWELYSWFDMACSARPHLHSIPNADSVCFALLPGTNRTKTADEIRKAPLPIAQLEKRIATLARGEQVFWLAPDTTFDLPDPRHGKTEPRNRAVAALKKRGVKLVVATR